MKHSHDVIILGGGAAGLTAASGMAQLGMKVALAESSHMGGDCLHFGCVPSKSLLKAARVRELSRRSSDFGLPSPELPEPEADSLNKRIAGVISGLREHDSPERFKGLGCDVFLQAGRFRSDHEIELEDGSLIGAGNIIVSTGSSPRIPPIPGLSEASPLTNRDIFSLETLPKRLTVLGAGPIGVEMSQAFGRLGVEITLVDGAPQILPREDEDMSAVIADELRREGVRLRLGVKISGVRRNGDDRIVSIESSSGSEDLVSDHILAALGRQGNTEELNLEAAGLAPERSFLPVDRKLRTARKHIMALGDVNGSYLFTHTAGAEGSFAVRRLGLKLPGSFSYRNTPWSTYCDPELASVGYNEKRAREAGIPYQAHSLPFGELDRARAEGEGRGAMKVLTGKRDRVIGVQIAALHGGDLLLPAVYAVREGWKLSAFLAPVVPYPSHGEIYKKLAGTVMGPRLFNPRTRRILRALYGYRGRRD